MGQKVNPHGIRVGVIKDWDSRWFAKDNVFGDTLVEDYNLRKVLKKQQKIGIISEKQDQYEVTAARSGHSCLF